MMLATYMHSVRTECARDPLSIQKVYLISKTSPASPPSFTNPNTPHCEATPTTNASSLIQRRLSTSSPDFHITQLVLHHLNSAPSASSTCHAHSSPKHHCCDLSSNKPAATKPPPAQNAPSKSPPTTPSSPTALPPSPPPTPSSTTRHPPKPHQPTRHSSSYRATTLANPPSSACAAFPPLPHLPQHQKP